MRITSWLKIGFELGKVRISLPVALSALTGYVMVTGQMGNKGWMLALGVFFISMASGTLNHYQEYKIDALMPRTKNRPIPTGRISRNGALAVTIGYFIYGSLILYFYHPVWAMLLSWLTLIAYNFIYTPLKKVTAFAVVPGSVIGALPPIIGWVAAGGNITDSRILIVAAFFFIGQIPHFWLLLLLFGDQYKLAGLPSLNQVFSETQIKRVTYTWTLTTIAGALVVLFRVFSDKTIFFILLVYVFYLLFSFTISFLMQKNLPPKPVFYKLNFLYLFMMIFLIVDGLIK
ncbi:MAG: protoheme IX farnesyltransferase [Prolixibacteraceae bacterium]|nr:protoheme IX farnesyltransferase [Prolixibacteraceae bacterium]MBN2774181.1 protoheme IX farnesyltransferase [Prolixibacteraceae bacterium]